MPLTSRSSLSLPPSLRTPLRRHRAWLRLGAATLTVVAAATPATAGAVIVPELSPPLVAAAAPPAHALLGAAGAPRVIASGGCPYTHLMPTPADMGLVAQAISCLVNQRRRAAGLAPLAPNGALSASAEGHSLSMVASDYFSHTSPAGRTPEQRMKAAGYTCHRSCSMGENIAWGSGSYGTASAIVSLWMASAPHRANILRRGFRFAGIGAVLGAPAGPWRHRGATTVTEDFGAGS